MDRDTIQQIVEEPIVTGSAMVAGLAGAFIGYAYSGIGGAILGFFLVAIIVGIVIALAITILAGIYALEENKAISNIVLTVFVLVLVTLIIYFWGDSF